MMRNLKKLINKLKDKKLKISVVESCSGGYLSYLLTKIPNSSKVFKGSIVAYTLEIKNKFFKIPFSILEKTEGVSKEIALLLAKKVKKIFNTDISVSIVGFAGPSARKGIKAGTVYIGFCYKNYSEVKKIFIKGNRDKVRKQASNFAVDLIYKNI